ncbi:MAG: hypothetical protein WC389_00040 [Lutibacter sp.]|jgi:hypothetical protein
MCKKQQNRRYQLHQSIKNNFEYDVKTKLVKLPHNFSEDHYSKKIVNALKELQKMNYSLQISIC